MDSFADSLKEYGEYAGVIPSIPEDLILPEEYE